MAKIKRVSSFCLKMEDIGRDTGPTVRSTVEHYFTTLELDAWAQTLWKLLLKVDVDYKDILCAI